MGKIEFVPGDIDGVVVRPLARHTDARGWLLEFYREDEIPSEFHPVMGYLSVTHAGVARGPHEHRAQADYFAFCSSVFRVYLWDPRTGSPSHGRKQVFETGAEHPTAVIVPAGVVHAYRNLGPADGTVINVPNRLYAGPHRREPVDEIRHEDAHPSPYLLD